MTHPSIDDILLNVRRYFPLQGPIKDFLHFNALAGFQNLPFEKAVCLAGELNGAHSYMSLGYYRGAYERGQVNETVLWRVVTKFASEKGLSEHLVYRLLFDYIEVHDTNVYFGLAKRAGISSSKALRVLQNIESKETKHGSHYSKIRQGCDEQTGFQMDAAINATLFRITSGFLDQGITLWQFPNPELGFLESVRTLVRDSYLPIAPFVRRVSMLAALDFEPDEIITTLLEKIVRDERLFENYIRDTLLAHAGWSGLINYLESRPTFLHQKRRITLKEFLAFKLILDWEFISHHCPKFVSLDSYVSSAENHQELMAHEKRALSFAWMKLSEPELEDEILFDAQDIKMLWHEALEMSAYRELLTALKVHDGIRKNQDRQKASAQAIFCLDDRECSFRRYLEELDSDIETFGCPGFFGVDFLFQSLNDPQPIQLCPPVLSPVHVVRECVPKGQEEEFGKQKTKTKKSALSLELWREASSSLFLGFVAANTLGHLSALQMLGSILKPQRLAKALKSRRIDIPTKLSIHRDSEVGDENGNLIGFTHIEMATRVEGFLRSIGLTQNFAPVIVAFAHGASSVNNPHFAAYDCAACSGKPGGPNARSFAHMANTKEVRSILSEKGLHIPDETFFVGAFHDTTTDFVEYFDIEDLSAEQRQKFDEFAQTVETVRGLNSQERCRRFASTSLEITISEALHETTQRALALFEPRPELGHATCFSCVVGRRDLTRGLFLDRRAFLNSYDPLADSSGEILTQILSAAIPVCGTVNLDYYFSRIDPAKYGCGTKLSHNIVGLLGVCNGIDDDLRTGLPVQMTELHDPIKLLMVIEQEACIITKVLRDNPHLLEWVQNGWIRIASVSPSSGHITVASPSLDFEALDLLGDSIPTFKSSRACYMGHRDNLPMASIV